VLALSLAVLVTGWWVVADLKIWNANQLPAPASVWTALRVSLTTREGVRGYGGYFLYQDLWASLWRILEGVFWAIAIGAPLGLLLSLVRPVRVVFEPYLSFLRSIPPLAYFSLLIIWFGIDDTSKIWLLFLAAFPPITLGVISGVERVRPEHVEAARALGASRWQVVRHTVIPSALPDLLTGIRIAFGFAWTTIVAAETTNGRPGIGGLAWSTHNQLQTNVAILCVIVIGLTAVAIDQALKLLERKVVPWKGRQ